MRLAALAFWLPRVVSAGKQAAPRLVFWHLEKAGGRLAIALLNDATRGEAAFTTVREWGFVPWAQRQFVVAPMREPCSYYVSEFNWGVSGKGFLRRALLATDRARDVADWYAAGQSSNLTAARAAFRAWVAFVTGDLGADATCGLLGARLWAAVLDPAAGARVNRRDCRGGDWRAIEKGRGCACPLLDCMRRAPSATRRQCSARVRAFGGASDARARDICWVRTERLVEDLGTCLAAFRRAGGRVAPARTSTRMTDAAFYSHGQASRERLWTCADLVGPNAGAEIYGYEGAIAARFNMTCCAAPPQPAPHQ